jgi:DNA-directed RNA polymerase delta subunit|tara:strand:+ start:436 stop:660 length:225 start_codon:yes stop_codon:yes gene_type:complete
MTKIFTSLMPLIPQPYKNIVKFFLATLKNVDDKEELKRIGNLFADILTDGKVTPQEWLSLGGKKGLNILRGNGK